MRTMRAVVFASLGFKVLVLSLWWWGSPLLSAFAATGAPVDPGVPAELFNKSRGFREMLEASRQRGDELDRREEAVRAREAALKSLEQLLNAETAKLEPAGGPGGKPGETTPCGVEVTKIYQSMKAEEAGPILDRLDDATVRAVFGCMKEKQIGAILAAMNRERAVALTKLLAEKKP
jgi:flagellar motility protein MotE (MotC chaperone)